MSVAGVVVTHGRHPELERCLDALRPQVDELVVVANPPAPDVDDTLIVNEKDAGFAANANAGISATSAPSCSSRIQIRSLGRTRSSA